jgi:uncharacterized membrane protein YfcA
VEINLVLGYAGAVVTGLVLGLLGGGGALLSIPVLVYFFHMDATVATGYSLFLVAIAATSGTVQNIRNKNIDGKAFLFYGIPSVTTVYIFRRFIIHQLPDIIFSTGSFSLTKDHLILFILSFVMFGVGFKMINATDEAVDGGPLHAKHYVLLVLYAIAVGCFIGLVGAGGGFLMTPALIYFAGLDMKRAIGTSILLVGVNSFIGFLGDIHSSLQMDWRFLILFSLFSVTGVLAGTYFSHRIDNRKLKISFGWFVLLLGVYIAGRETMHF